MRAIIHQVDRFHQRVGNTPATTVEGNNLHCLLTDLDPESDAQTVHVGQEGSGDIYVTVTFKDEPSRTIRIDSKGLGIPGSVSRRVDF